MQTMHRRIICFCEILLSVILLSFPAPVLAGVDFGFSLIGLLPFDAVVQLAKKFKVMDKLDQDFKCATGYTLTHAFAMAGLSDHQIEELPAIYAAHKGAFERLRQEVKEDGKLSAESVMHLESILAKRGIAIQDNCLRRTTRLICRNLLRVRGRTEGQQMLLAGLKSHLLIRTTMRRTQATS